MSSPRRGSRRISVTTCAVITALAGVLAVPTAASATATAYGTQRTLLDSSSLSFPVGVALDAAGDVYVADVGNNEILELPAGSSTPIALPLPGLSSVEDMAVDAAGDLYVLDWINGQVLEFLAGSTTPITLSFPNLAAYATGIAVDGDGDVFVADSGHGQILELPNGSSTPVALPFPYLYTAVDVATDAAGNVYALDQGNPYVPVLSQVVELPSGSSTPVVLPFTGMQTPKAMFVDPAGDVYVADSGNQQILELLQGASSPTTLPFTDLANPAGLAVDSAGDVFVSNAWPNVLELPIAGPPAISAVAPAVGPTSGGTVITVNGSGFSGATKVSFGAAGQASSFSVVSDNQITATTPAYPAGGKVHVRVTTAVGSTTPTTADLFRYGTPPAVTGLSPSTGPTGGGTSVTIAGSGFTGATKVTFGAAAATSVTVNGDNSITATSPAGSGNVHVRVTTGIGTSGALAADLFHYGSPPAVSAVSPANAPAAGGTSVTITGSGFTGATKVSFGATAATGVTVNDDTSITATVPAGSGSVHVRVTTPIGTSPATTADLFGYGSAPTVSGISPASGPSGTVVTVNGVGFLGTTKVTFGANAASFTVFSDTQIIATAPAGSGNAHIRVTNPVGSTTTSPVDLFHYTG